MMAGKIESVIMTVIFVIIAGCFSIPVIIYVTDSQDVTPGGNIIDHLDISDCTWQAIQVWEEHCSAKSRSYISYMQLCMQQYGYKIAILLQVFPIAKMWPSITC